MINKPNIAASVIIKNKNMKNYQFIILGLCLFLASCATIAPTYFGDKFTPTSTVDIYYSAHDVKQPYKVIGHLTYPNTGQEKVKSAFVAYAKTIGADAIVIVGNTVDNSGKYASDVVNADALKYNK
jgi:hypothetical protein